MSSERPKKKSKKKQAEKRPKFDKMIPLVRNKGISIEYKDRVQTVTMADGSQIVNRAPKEMLKKKFTAQGMPRIIFQGKTFQSFLSKDNEMSSQLIKYVESEKTKEGLKTTTVIEKVSDEGKVKMPTAEDVIDGNKTEQGSKTISKEGQKTTLVQVQQNKEEAKV